MSDTRCKNCDRILRAVGGRKKTIKDQREAELYSRYIDKTVIINDVFCNKCRMIPYRFLETLISSSQIESSVDSDHSEEYNRSILHTIKAQDEDNPIKTDSDEDFYMQLNKSSENDSFIELPIKRVIATHKYCIICRSIDKIKKIPLEARVQAFTKKRIFIPDGDRCCVTHLIGNVFYEDELSSLQVYSNTSCLKPEEVSLFVEVLAKGDSSLIDKVSDFTMPEEQLRAFTGLYWKNIIELREMFMSMRHSDTRSVTQALVVFLMKLTTGNSNRLIAGILGLEYEQSVSNFCIQIINGFEKDILPSYFGFVAMSREDLIDNHTTYVAKKLYNITHELMLIFDGTYVRHQKSFNNEYQRKSYSGQKKMPLCKPFTICCTDGYIVDILGPFYGTQNDATIMKTVLEDPQGLTRLLRPGDLFLIDRGFRDVEEQIKDEGYVPLMPAFKGKRKQLTTEESNGSRKITKLRWVVEAVHGSIGQKYKLLHHAMDNKMLPKVKSLCRIVGFLHNRFGKRLESDNELADEIIEYMNAKMNTINTLSVEVETQNWNKRKKPFKTLMASELMDFPKLGEPELKILFTGSYQLSQAVSYLAELTGDQESPQIQYIKDSPNILKIEVKSRHKNSKTYRCYIDYVPYGKRYTDVKRWTCDCPNGNRTMGCCSHIASIIYYLSFARYLSRIFKPAEILTKIFDKNNVSVVINSDSDED